MLILINWRHNHVDSYGDVDVNLDIDIVKILTLIHATRFSPSEEALVRTWGYLGKVKSDGVFVELKKRKVHQPL